VPLGRIGEASEVAAWICRLLGPSASFITGTVLPIDGGQVLDHR
jgi:NAD(P)-dependent dehydrogenase (short-subunit alcohol dehydrogenase family)